MAGTDVKLRLLIQAVNTAGKSLEDAKRQLNELGASSQKVGAESRKAGQQGKEGFDEFSKGADKAAQEVQQLESAVGDLAAAGAALVAVGAALAATVIFPVARAADFERAMKGVLAVTTGADEAFSALSAKAAELGRTTKFTATEAAEGMRFLGQAGFEAGEVITAIGPSLQLAAAGGLDLATAADIASNVVSAMRLEVEDLSHVADVLANTAASSNTNVLQLAEALKYAAPIAASAGLTLEETAAAIGVLGNNGIQASMAGTTMRAMLISLAGPTKQAQEALSRLGVEIAKNDDGSINLTETLRRLREANFDLSDAAAIFRRTAASGALALANQIEEVEALTVANEIAVGAAEKMARTMEDNLIGAITLLTSALDGLLRAIGAPLLNGITSVVRVITSWISALANLADQFPTLITIVASLVATLAALTTGFGGLLLASAAVVKIFLVLKSGLTALVTIWAALQKAILAARAASLAFLATPVGIAITALIGVLALGVIAWDKWRFGSEKAAQAAQQLGAEIADQQDKLQRYGDALENLEEGTREYSIVAAEVAKIVPGITLTLDENGQIVAEVSEEYEDMADAVQKFNQELEVKRLKAMSDELYNNVRALEKERFWIDLNTKAHNLLTTTVEKTGKTYDIFGNELSNQEGALKNHNDKLAESADKQAALKKSIDEVINAMVKEGLTAEQVAAKLDAAGASAPIKEQALESYAKFTAEMEKTGKTSVDVQKELQKIQEEALSSGEALQKFGEAAEKAYKQALAKADEYANKVEEINKKIRSLETSTEEEIRELRRDRLSEEQQVADRTKEIEELKNQAIAEAEAKRYDEAERLAERARDLARENFKERIKLAEEDAKRQTDAAREQAREAAKAVGKEFDPDNIPPIVPTIDTAPLEEELQGIDQLIIENILEPQKEAAQESEDAFRASAENIKQVYEELKVTLQDIDVKVTAEGFDELLDKLQEAAGEDIEVRAKTIFTGVGSSERPITEKIDEINSEFDSMADKFGDDLKITVDATEAFSTIREIQRALDSLRDKTVTVTVRKVEENSAGGIIGEALKNTALRLSRGWKLPGYGGGDRVHAMLEPGERVTNKRSVSILDSVLPGMMDALNNVRSNLDVEKIFKRIARGFSGGGMVGAFPNAPVLMQAGGTVVQKPDLADFGRLELQIGREAFPVLAPQDVIENLKSAVGREKLIRSN